MLNLKNNNKIQQRRSHFLLVNFHSTVVFSCLVVVLFLLEVKCLSTRVQVPPQRKAGPVNSVSSIFKARKELSPSAGKLQLLRDNTHSNPSPRSLHDHLSSAYEIVSHTVEEIARDFINPVAVLCTLSLAIFLFVLEYLAFKIARDREEAERKNRQLAKAKEVKRSEGLHYYVSEEEEEEESKESKSLGVATGIIGIIAQSLNLAAGKTLVVLEANEIRKHLTEVLTPPAGGELHATRNSTATTSNTELKPPLTGIAVLTADADKEPPNIRETLKNLKESEQIQLIKNLLTLKQNVTQLRDHVKPNTNFGLIGNNVLNLAVNPNSIIGG